MFERWKQRALNLNVKKTVITFIVTALVVIAGFSAALYGNFHSRVSAKEQEEARIEAQYDSKNADGQDIQGAGQKGNQDPDGTDSGAAAGQDEEASGEDAENPEYESEKEGSEETMEGSGDQEYEKEGSEESAEGFVPSDGPRHGMSDGSADEFRRGNADGENFQGGHFRGKDFDENFNGEDFHGGDFHDGEAYKAAHHEEDEITLTTGDKVLITFAGIAGALLLIWYWILVMIWAYRKATRLGLKGIVWVWVTLFLNLISILILYLYGLIKGTCTRCGHVRAHGENYCERCGAPFEKECPNCGHHMRASAKYCPNCGRKMDDADQSNTGSQSSQDEGSKPDENDKSDDSSKPDESDKSTEATDKTE